MQIRIYCSLSTVHMVKWGCKPLEQKLPRLQLKKKNNQNFSLSIVFLIIHINSICMLSASELIAAKWLPQWSHSVNYSATWGKTSPQLFFFFFTHYIPTTCYWITWHLPSFPETFANWEVITLQKKEKKCNAGDWQLYNSPCAHQKPINATLTGTAKHLALGSRIFLHTRLSKRFRAFTWLMHPLRSVFIIFFFLLPFQRDGIWCGERKSSTYREAAVNEWTPVSCSARKFQSGYTGAARASEG